MESQILQLFKEFGAPYLLLVLSAIAVWRVLTWFGVRVVTPLVESHTGLINQLQNSDKKQTELLETNTRTQVEILGTQKEIVELIREERKSK